MSNSVYNLAKQEFDDQLILLDEDELQNEASLLPSDDAEVVPEPIEEITESLKEKRRQRSALHKENKHVILICMHNGITRDKFVKSVPTSLEMCHYNYTKIVGLHHFEGLTSLTILAQDITSISGLDRCRALKELWICETKISDITGLENCTELRKLHLYANKITAIKNLDNLTKLERLWLFDNEICRVENLEQLTTLTDLHLANNKIKYIGRSLRANIALQQLNISGNHIYSFLDVLNLANLPSLTSLSMADPNFANNPICSLCNYQTHLIYHLPQLTILDTLEVPLECRKIIASTVTKKRMFYTMKIKCIKRNTNFFLKGLQDEANERARDIIEEIRVAHRQDKLSANLQEDSQLSELSTNFNTAARLQGTKVLTLNAFQQAKETANLIKMESDKQIRSLLVELETGGNVRFEEGLPTDPWYKECEEIIKPHIALYNTVGAKCEVKAVVKLHNRYLQSCFESRCAKPTGAKIQQLLYHENFPTLCKIAEKGFSYLDDDENEDFGVTLVNWVEYQRAPSTPKSGNAAFAKYEFLVAKVYMGNSVEVNSRKGEKKLERLPRSSYSEYDTAYRRDFGYRTSASLSRKIAMKGADPTVTTIFDRQIALPLYIVEYTVSWEPSPSRTFSDKISRLVHRNWLLDPNMTSGIYTDLNRSLEQVNKNDRRRERRGQVSVSLSTSFLRERYKSPQTTLSCPFQLIRKVEKYAIWSQLRILCLAHNEIENVNAIKLLTGLHYLDLSFNRIVTIDCLQQLRNVDFFDISGNLICHVKEIHRLIKSFQSLRQLDIRFNPIVQRSGYHEWLIHQLENLDYLDGEPVTLKVREYINLAYQESINDALRDKSSNLLCPVRPLGLRTYFGEESLSACGGASPSANGANRSYDPTELTTLEFDGCSLWNLDWLPAEMPRLRWASFNENNLCDISLLSRYPNLEELSLEDNDVTSVEALRGLENLAKLDLSNNNIVDLEGLRGFRTLTQLCLQNNGLTSLKSLVKLPCLSELYVGKNKIADLYDVFPLKEMPKLIILDMAGNPVCDIPSYRSFTVYHINRLKMLDGLIISAKEQTSCREQYQGKLTIELLAEKIGHFAFHNISELDIRNTRLKNISCFNAMDYRNLRKINFDNNLLTNIDDLIPLINLKYLCLNSNRLEKLFSPEMESVAREDAIETSYKPLFPCLEEMQLGYNLIQKVTDLNLFRFPALKILHLHGNQISKIEGFEQLTTLRELVLDKNQIRIVDANAFASLKNLHELHMKENRLRSLDNFNCLVNLEHLFLSGNRIHDLSEIEKLRLPNLIEISLSSNAVARKQLYRHLQMLHIPSLLIIDAKEITVEDRERAEAYYQETLCRDDSILSNTGNIHIGSHSETSLSTITRPPISLASMTKLPMKVSSVVFDGDCRPCEMAIPRARFPRSLPAGRLQVSQAGSQRFV